MELVYKTIVEYVDQVDSSMPAPGGGSAASLVGALGVCLSRMSAHLSINKKKFKEANKKDKNKYLLAFNELEHYKDVLLKGIDDDASSYQAVMAAFSSKDENKIQKALLSSAFIGFEILNASYKSLCFVDKMVALCNKNLYSDLYSGAILLNSCVELTSLNVIANASLLKDIDSKTKYLNESQKIVDKANKLKNKIIRNLKKEMSNI